jgi:Transcription termination factor nusG
MQRDSEWKLVYTKVHCEAWSEANLRNQGFSVLLPRVRARAGFAPLFPRYLFVGHEPGRDTRALRSTRGVRYVVMFADHPVRVPQSVIDEVRGRMDAQGVVHLEREANRQPLFDRRERERVRTLVKLAQAGFRVAIA